MYGFYDYCIVNLYLIDCSLYQFRPTNEMNEFAIRNDIKLNGLRN
jgi:hypothetical protein